MRTQGRGKYEQWSTKYSLKYSDDGTHWTTVVEDGFKKVL